MLENLDNKLLRLRIQSARYANYYKEAGPRWALMFASSRLLPVRTAVMKMQKPPDLEKYHGKPTLFPGTDIECYVADAERDGFAEGMDLSPEVTEQISSYGRNAEAYKNNPNPHRSLIYLTDFLDVRRDLPVIQQIEQDPVMLEIAARYLNHEPVHMGTRLWWATVKDSTLAERTKFGQELFHHDLHDYRSIKFNWYLTEVTEAGGGTACIRGSHKHKKLAHQASLFIGRTDEEMFEVYGKDAMHVTVGKPGKGFCFDPYAFHRGTRPAGDRLMMQIEFGRNRYLKNCYADAAPLKI